MIGLQGQTWFAVCVYCQINWMICENIFNRGHHCTSNLFWKIPYFAMCFSTWDCLVSVYCNPECRKLKASVSAPRDDATSFLKFSESFSHLSSHPWVRIQVLSILWSQWESVISLAWYWCCKKLEFFFIMTKDQEKQMVGWGM